jgi:hypothetical protein
VGCFKTGIPWTFSYFVLLVPFSLPLHPAVTTQASFLHTTIRFANLAGKPLKADEIAGI